MENNWYVYQHIRLDKKEPFYIGIGNKKNYLRAFEFSKDKRNEMWWKIYNKTTIKVEIVYMNLSKQDASIKEQELIKKYGRKNLNEGSLCNMTDGGDGIWNCKRSEETKKRQSLGAIKSGQAKEVDVYKYDTNEYIGRFYAIAEACRNLGIPHLHGKASQVAKGKRNHTQGYVFRYVKQIPTF